MRLLIIEDNVRISALVHHALRDHGFTSDQVSRLSQADEALRLALYDAVILDLGLPDGDGLTWLNQRRGVMALPPVLILTSRSALGDRVSGLDAGADDYLIKPFAVDELAARLRALLRRPGSCGPAMLQNGMLCFDLARHAATVGETALEISRREGDLLELLMRRSGSVVNRIALENAIYGFDEPVTPNAMEALVSRLRRKLDDVGVGDLLVTVRGVGYMMRDAPA